MSRLPEGYLTMNLDGEDSYVRVDSLGQLRSVDAIIFDCDGVLIYTGDSYDRAISMTAAYVFEALTGYAMQPGFVSDEVISLFRRSGGFNNDWDTVYGVLMFLLSQLPERLRCELEERMESIGTPQDTFKRLTSIRGDARGVEEDKLGDRFFEDSMEKLKGFTKLLDETGAESVDRNLGGAEASEGLRRFTAAMKCFLRYPGRVGESIVATVFEEFFCGSRLFMETYGIAPRFHQGPGMVENEQPIVRPVTLDSLTSLLGKGSLGVASGSRHQPAKYILGELLERFRPEASVFFDDVEDTEDEHSEKSGFRVDLKKPNPFSLLKAAEALDPCGMVLYLGDSMADALMVRRANRANPSFVFAGVYGSSHFRDDLLSDFIESGCELALPSVNELPTALEWIRRGRFEDH